MSGLNGHRRLTMYPVPLTFIHQVDLDCFRGLKSRLAPFGRENKERQERVPPSTRTAAQSRQPFPISFFVICCPCYKYGFAVSRRSPITVNKPTSINPCNVLCHVARTIMPLGRTSFGGWSSFSLHTSYPARSGGSSFIVGQINCFVNSIVHYPCRHRFHGLKNMRMDSSDGGGGVLDQISFLIL